MSRSKVSTKKKKQKKQPDLLRDTGAFLGSLLNGLVSVYMLLLMVVMPFYFTDGYARIGTNKYEFFYEVSTKMGLIMAPFLLIYAILQLVIYVKREGHKPLELWKDFSVTDWFALGYGVIVTLSYFCSDFQAESVYGSALKGAKGWYMGLASQLIFVGIYFVVSRCWKRYKGLLFLWFPVTLVVFGLGYLNRFEVRPLEMKNATIEFISTIGNMNWYCGYVVILFFGGLYYIWSQTEKNRGLRIFFYLWLTVGFATLLTQGSQSGILALGGVLVALYLMSMGSMEKLLSLGSCLVCMGLACSVTGLVRLLFPERFNYPDAMSTLFTNSPVAILLPVLAVLFCVGLRYLQKKGIAPLRVFRTVGYGGCALLAVALVIFVTLGIVNTKSPGSIGALSEVSAFTFDMEWGSKRGAAWAAAFMCFGEQDFSGKMIGVGPDSMAMYVYSGTNQNLVDMMRESFAHLSLTNAHCEWLTMLVNVGLLGMIAYAGMMVSAIVRYIKAGKSSAIVGACGLAVFAYTLNNMVSFQQAMGAATIFLVLGIGEAYMRGAKEGKQ